MADKNLFQNAGDYTLDGVLIVGSSGWKINVLDQIQELNNKKKENDTYLQGTQ